MAGMRSEIARMQAEQDIYLDQLNKSTSSPRRTGNSNSNSSPSMVSSQGLAAGNNRRGSTTVVTNLSGVMFEDDEPMLNVSSMSESDVLSSPQARTLRFMAKEEAEAAAAATSRSLATTSSSTGSSSFNNGRRGGGAAAVPPAESGGQGSRHNNNSSNISGGSGGVADRRAKIAASANAVRDMLLAKRGGGDASYGHGGPDGKSQTKFAAKTTPTMSHGKGIPALNKIPRVLNSPGRAQRSTKATNATKVRSTASHKVTKAMPAWLANSMKTVAQVAVARVKAAHETAGARDANANANANDDDGDDDASSNGGGAGNDALNQSILLMSEMEGVIVGMKTTMDSKASELNEMQEELELTQKQLMEEAAKHQDELAHLQSSTEKELSRTQAMKRAHTAVTEEAEAHIAEVTHNHAAEVEELSRQIEEIGLELDAAMTTLEEHAVAGAALTIAGQEKDNTIAELRLALAARDARVESLESTVDRQDDEVRRLKEVESNLYETQIELSLQRSIVAQLNEDAITRKKWQQEKANKTMAERNKKPVWKGGSRHTHAPNRGFGVPKQVVRSPVAKAQHHVARPALTFSKPPVAHDKGRTAELRTLFATARHEDEQQEQEEQQGEDEEVEGMRSDV